MTAPGIRLLLGAGGGGGGAFDPTDVSGLVAWYDASDTATITDAGSGAVSQWNDKSVNAFHVTQATSANRPTTGTRTLNSLNVIDFDGSNDVLFINAVTTLWGQTSTAFVVAQSDASHVGNLISHVNPTSGDYIRLVEVNGPIRLASRDDAGSDDLQLNSTSSLSSAGIVTATAVASTSASLRINGTQEASVGIWNAGTWSVGRFCIGRQEVSSPIQPFNGIIAEVIIYDSALGSTDRDAVEAYLADKWGISI